MLFPFPAVCLSLCARRKNMRPRTCVRRLRGKDAGRTEKRRFLFRTCAAADAGKFREEVIPCAVKSRESGRRIGAGVNARKKVLRRAVGAIQLRPEACRFFSESMKEDNPWGASHPQLDYRWHALRAAAPGLQGWLRLLARGRRPGFRLFADAGTLRPDSIRSPFPTGG